jgi:hypothetical protein
MKPPAMNDKPAFWFPVKRYGWGWGLPVRWQGWLVFASYAALMYLGIDYFRPRRDLVGLIVYAAILTMAFIAIVVAKGERPAGWRWGKH